MEILTWIIFGAIIGFLADLLVGGEGLGCFASIFVGIIGSFVGNSLLHLVQTGNFNILATTSLSLGNIVVSVIGAILFVGFIRAVSGK